METLIELKLFNSSFSNSYNYQEFGRGRRGSQESHGGLVERKPWVADGYVCLSGVWERPWRITRESRGLYKQQEQPNNTTNNNNENTQHKQRVVGAAWNEKPPSGEEMGLMDIEIDLNSWR